MSEQHNQLETLQEIRALMERASRFLSLSGKAGIFIGMYALLCVVSVYIYLDLSLLDGGYYRSVSQNSEKLATLVTGFIFVLIFSLVTGFIWARIKAKRFSLLLWDATAKRFLIHFFTPLLVGGIVCIFFLVRQQIDLILPFTLIFYGLALLNASKYTIEDIFYIGITEIAVGLSALFFIEYALLLWGLGFGILHIVYGLTIYQKYEK